MIQIADRLVRGRSTRPIKLLGGEAILFTAACSLVLLLGCVGGKASMPSLAGHSLGSLWSTSARALPCRSDPRESDEPGAYATAALAHYSLKWCSASEGVTLFFVGDTLRSINIKGGEQEGSPEPVWRSTVVPVLLPEFGEPDSVSSSAEARQWINAATLKTQRESCVSCSLMPRFVTVDAVWKGCSTGRLWVATAHIFGTDSTGPSAPLGSPFSIELRASSHYRVNLVDCRLLELMRSPQ